MISPVVLPHSGPPQAWPPSPAVFSYSSLKALEACPRQWALRKAAYPALWQGRGYPGRPNGHQLRGILLHGALEDIARALVRESGPRKTMGDALRQLGGLSAVLKARVARIGAELRSNPRASAAVAELEREAAQNLGQLRSQLQDLVSRLPHTAGVAGPVGQVGTAKGEGAALAAGLHTEVTLHHRGANLMGVVDLLALTSEGACIVDFKTGKQADDHVLQLRIYALLWLHDADRNPEGRPVTALTIRYPTGDQVVPVPSVADLHQLEADLQERTRLAREKLDQSPPRAQCGSHCFACDVRHLCPEYWSGPAPDSPEEVGRGRCDLELTLTGEHRGGLSDGLARAVPGSTPAAPVQVRWAGASQQAWQGLARGRALRVLGAIWKAPDALEGGMPVVVLAEGTEVFVEQEDGA